MVLKFVDINVILAGALNLMNKSSPMPRRSPPPPPSVKSSSQAAHTPKATGGGGVGGGPLGAFWSTQHANETTNKDTSQIRFDEESTSHSTSKRERINPNNHSAVKNASPGDSNQKSNKTVSDSGSFRDFELSFFQNETGCSSNGAKASKPENAAFQDKAFNNFVAEFDTSKFSSDVTNNRPGKEVAASEAEVEKLKDQLKQANMEKAEITSKFEKLSAICRSQRQEIQELKQSLAARNIQPSTVPRVFPRFLFRPFDLVFQGKPPSLCIFYLTFQVQKADSNTRTPDAKPWQALAGESPIQQPDTPEKGVKSVRTRSLPRKQASPEGTGFESWGFGSESFTAVSAGSSNATRLTGERSSSQRIDRASQPAGWAGF